MGRFFKIAVTETINAYRPMPATLPELGQLEGRLEAIREANVAHHLELIAQAAGRGVRAIGLGEMFTGPYFAISRHPMWLALAEDAATGPTISALRNAAKQHQMVIVAPIYERDPASDQRYNTAVVIDAGGAILGKYRKTHIPEGKNEQNAFNEPFYFGKADSEPYFPTFDTAIGKIGVAICYDRHFEGVVRTLAAGGAELIFSPAVTFGAKSERMWEMEFQVDAARHNVFIAGSNRLGEEPPWNQPYFGKSYVTGPNGKIAPEEPKIPGLVIAGVDLDALTAADPSGWKLIRDRRPAIYKP
jgi:N-carbamoylputrescine amidase